MARTTKKDQIAAEVRKLLISGEIPRGTRIRQNELAKRFQASVTPVREAMLQLEAEGLVESGPRKGARAATIDLDRVKGIYAARRLLEPYAMQRACFRLSSRDISQARAANHDMAIAASATNRSGVREANQHFHFFLYQRAEMPPLLRLIEMLWLSFPWDILHAVGTGTEDALAEHEEIIEALATGDAEGAGDATSRHIARSYRTLATHLLDEDAIVGDPFELEVD